MGFGDLDVTSVQKMTALVGGSLMEYGTYVDTTNTQSHAIPTTFKTLIGGVACSSMSYGQPKSITGDVIDVSFGGAATKAFSYIFFGW